MKTVRFLDEDVEDPPLVKEMTPLLEASKEWKKSMVKREVSLPWYMNRHFILFILAMSTSLLLVAVMHQVSGSTTYRLFSANDVNRKESKIALGKNSRNAYDARAQYSNGLLVFESLAEDEHEVKNSNSSNSSSESKDNDNNDDGGKEHEGRNRGEGEDKQEVYCDENGRGPCIQEFFGSCLSYSRCIPYDSPLPTSVPTSMPSTSSPTNVFKCDPNDPPCKVKSSIGIGCAEHHTCLPSEYNTSTPSSYPTPMPSTNDDCDPMHPPCRSYLLSSFLCYEYIQCHRAVNMSALVPHIEEPGAFEIMTYDNNATIGDGGNENGEEDNDNKLFTPIPSMAPTPTGPCDPENPDTQPCRHAISGRCIERIECTGRNMTIQEELQQPKNKLHINGTDVEHE